MNPTRFLNFLNCGARFCFAPDGDGTGGAAAGVPTTAVAATTSNDTASATTGTTAGAVAEAAGDQSSAAASVPAGVGAQADTTQAGDFRTGWDDKLKNDPALKDIKTSADLAKSFLETKKLVGQKLGIPAADATPEAKAAFYEAMGVPKDPAGYEFKVPDEMPQTLKDFYDQGNADKWAKIFADNHIPKEAGDNIRKAFFAEIGDALKDVNADIETSEEEFGKLAKGIYGDDAKAKTALESVRTMVEKHVPPSLKAGMDQLSNSALLIMAAVIRGETLELSGEDKTLGGPTGVTADGKTKDQLRQEARELQALPEYNSAFTPKGKVGHDDVVSKVKAIYDRIGKMT